MKKSAIAFAVIFLLALSSVFAACADGEENIPDRTVYEITTTGSELYSYGMHTTRATAGTDAYVVVEPEYAAVGIAAVYFNGQPCAKDAAEKNRYNYTMPAEDVTITVDLDFTDTAEDDGFLSWGENETVLTAGTGTADLEFITDWAYTSLTKVEIYASANRSVIPDEALSISYYTDGSLIEGGKISIDLSKVSVGKTQIVLALQSSNVDTYDGCIVCSVEVREPQPIIHVEQFTGEVTFKIPGTTPYERFFFEFTDLSYEENTDAKEYQNFWSDDGYAADKDGYVTVRPTYVVGHVYAVRAGYFDEYGVLKEWSVNFANDENNVDYDSGRDELTFDGESGSVTLVLGKY